MTHAEGIAIAAWIWAAVWAMLALVSINRARWTVATLAAVLATFFGRYGISTWRAGGHSVAGWEWVSDPRVILAHTIAGTILTAGVVCELLVRGETPP